MKTINRAKIKGKPLDNKCKSARVCVECDKENKYCFCYGIIDLHYDDYIGECKNCKACVRNMPNWKEDFKEVLCDE